MTEQEFDQKFSKVFENASKRELVYINEQMKRFEEENNGIQDQDALVNLIVKVATLSLDYSNHLIHDALKEFFVESKA